MRPKLCEQDVLSNIDHLRKTVGLFALESIQLDEFDTTLKENRRQAILDCLKGQDQGSKIINEITCDIDKTIYPSNLFSKNRQDLLSLALKTRDCEFFLDIYKCMRELSGNTNDSHEDVFRDSFTSCLNQKSDKQGPKEHDDMLRALHLQKVAIITGVLTSGKKHIDGIDNRDHALKCASDLVGHEEKTIDKYCYERDFEEGHPFITRHAVEAIMKIEYNKRDSSIGLPKPSRIDCYKAVFNALHHKYPFWDNN